MAELKVGDIRTIGIIGANGSGKTTLVDAVMFAAGANTRQGSVDQGTSLSDTGSEEQARKISIRATPLNCRYGGKDIFLIDTPGYADFYGEVALTLEVVDAVVIVVDGVAGMEVGTLRVWEAAREQGLPIGFFISKLDKEHSNFSSTLSALEEGASRALVPVTLPDGTHPAFSAVCKLSEEGIEDKVDPALREGMAKIRESMIEAAAESDDALLEKYFETGELTPEEINEGFRNAFTQGKVSPVFAGAALSGKGVKELLDGICDLFPSPETRGEVRVGDETVKPGASEPLCAQVFKSVNDPYVGQISFARIWAGTLKADAEIFNATSASKERVGHILLIKGKEQQSIEQAAPGFIVALPKLKNTSSGDTLCDPGHRYVFPPIKFPSPTTLAAVYAKDRGDEDKIAEAFPKIISEDPTLRMDRNPMTGEFVLTGMGDVQFQVAVNRLKQNFKVEIELREPKVAYKETITSRGETKYRHKKQTGGAGQFAEVWMHVQPYTEGAENSEGKARRELIELGWGGKLLFMDEVVGGHIPSQLVQSVKKGYLSAMAKGPLAGFPVVDVIATVYDGKTHPVDSKDIAFQIAGRQGFKESCRAARPVLLEPIMKVAITVPTEYMGAVTGDLNSRRGRVLGLDPKGASQVVNALVPMAELLKYSTELRSMTGGAGHFTMEYDHYEEVPSVIAQKIIAEVKQEQEEE
ncbi:MAG TPA: elongation factor G [bacterium]|nr:elongation factor G [bacterium]HPJ71202.1 elongation factor G [bacterium]